MDENFQLKQGIKYIQKQSFKTITQNITNGQLNESMEFIQKDFEFRNFKTYFDVNNLFVFKKIQKILFPFRTKVSNIFN